MRLISISIHALVKGATNYAFWIWYRVENFNPRTRHPWRVRPLKDYTDEDLIEFQSTHPWRVRRVGAGAKFIVKIISIHAPVKGATWYRADKRRKPFYFNPRTREGCDAREVTDSKSASVFQSTHPWRVRRQSSFCVRDAVLFQSTHPWRVRLPNEKRQKKRILYFNPRTREGCDKRKWCFRWSALYFNPRTREGCDLRTLQQLRSVL